MTKREGDTRDFEDDKFPLNLWPDHDEPLRWHPEHGEPTCILEWVSQTTCQHRIALYIALVTTLTLCVAVWGVPRWVPFVEMILLGKVAGW